ncbi:MAG: hypothetical protein AAFN70_18730, partial [Planctomycetota bacterium]
MKRLSQPLFNTACQWAGWSLIILLLIVGTVVDSVAQVTAPVLNPPKSEKDSPQAESAKKKSGDRYLRITRDEKEQPESMQTAIVRYIGKPGSKHEGKIVDLVGVVHIGEGPYYENLKSTLSQYDVVLYELVAPNGTRIRPEDLKGNRGILASMQTGMKDMLNLEYQLEKIDYMAENFRHADMSPEEFAGDMKKRGDSVWKMFARMMGAGLASQATRASQGSSDADVLMAMFSTKDRSKKMKQIMAQQMKDMDAVTAGMNDATGTNTIIVSRNAKVMEILTEELAKDKKELAIFYGAGHLKDMAERLERDWGLVLFQIPGVQPRGR